MTEWFLYFSFFPLFGRRGCDRMVFGFTCVCLMVLNATFNIISVISWWSVLLVEETGGPGENHQPVASH